MTTVLTKPVTAVEFWQMSDSGRRRELIQGEVFETMPPGGQHGAIAVALATLLQLWVRAGAGGYVGVEAGYVLERDPDTVRGPDVSYVGANRLPAGGIPEGFWNLAPDLAVEIISPTETAEAVRAKVRDYLNAGTSLVWTIYPSAREVIAHTPNGVAQTFMPGTKLAFPDALPGFSCTVDELFE